MEHEELVAAGNEAPRVIHRGKYRVLVCFSVEIGIREADDPAHSRAFSERSEKIDADEDLTLGRCRDAGG